MINPEDSFEICGERRAILDSKGHMLVVGGPGSGKTTIALLKARRIALCELEEVQSVLFLSFSNSAVRRIGETATEILVGQAGGRIDIKTYHSFAWEILRAHGYLLSCRRRLRIVPAQDADVLRAGMTDVEWNAEQERLFIEEGRLTYDQFAPNAADILQRSRKLRELYSAAHPIIFVDEFQDTDDAQWGLVKALSLRSDIIALGDNGQRIYDWRRGVSPRRLEQFSEELDAPVFDFGIENKRSPTTGIAGFGRALLNPDQRLPDCEEVAISRFDQHQFGLAVKFAVRHALGEAKKRAKKQPISVAVAGRSRSLVRIISDALSQSQNANERRYGPVAHEVLIDQSQILLSARVTAFLLEAPTYHTQEGLAKAIELIADMHRAGGRTTHIATADRLSRWALRVREGQPPNTRFVVAVKRLLQELEKEPFTGSPTADWVRIRGKIEGSDVADLSRVADFVRFLRILRRGSTIEESLSEIWRGQGHYRGAMVAVEEAILRDQLIDATRPPAECTVMTMHQLKSREYDVVVIIEDQFRRFLGRGEEAPFMETRRLLQMSVTRARHYAVLLSPRKNSTLQLLG